MTMNRTTNRPTRQSRARRSTSKGKPEKLHADNLLAATIEDARRLRSFALILEGDALEPDFKDGDLLTVSTNTLPLPGDCVVALVRGSYACLRLNADGDLTDNKGGFVPRGFYTLAGVVLDRTPRD